MGSEQSQLSEYVDRNRVASWLLAVAVIRVPQCGNNDPPEGEHHAPAETRQSNYQIISNNHLTPRAQPPAADQLLEHMELGMGSEGQPDLFISRKLKGEAILLASNSN